ncbi:hypothetical protein FOL47_009015 [Perkinsus chesapeaki]|uniref:Uncharacterized protein n=1 Tax=Perkinsus chesapeaki TaxID=330153 RepID=A0A7J6LBN6_PERCH|nr:hypothetical protein FOL47_009015 [Perkinsus chesapeaki]
MDADKPLTADSLPSETAERILEGSGGDDEAPGGPLGSNESSAFLTGINLERQRRGSQGQEREAHAIENKGSVLASVPVAGPKVLNLFEQLNTLASTLPERVVQLLEQHEHDFMLAYKTHMYTVQKQFRELKGKADKEDERVRRDNRVQELEKELKWFMSEALRLDALCKDYRKEVGKWRSRAETLSEDRRYLEDQMKASKRQTKVLRAVLERAQASKSHPGPEPPSQMMPGNSSGQPGRRDMVISRDPQDMTAERSSGTMAEAAKKVSPEEAEYLTKIGELETELRGLRRTRKMLEDAVTERYARRSELEDFFLACVDEARKDASRRKYSGHGVRKMSPVNARQEAIDALVSSEEVLVFLYEKMFPHRASTVTAAAKVDNVATNSAAEKLLKSTRGRPAA